MSLFEVLQSRESLVKVLCQVQHFLAHLDDVGLFTARDDDHALHDAIRDQRCFLKLLANLQCDVEAAHRDEALLAARQVIVVHTHLAQVHRHLLDQEALALRRVTRGRQRFLLLFSKTGVAHVPNFENITQVDAQEVKDGGRRNLVVNCLEVVQFERFDFLLGDLLVGNLLEDHLHLERIDIFVLRRDKHRRHAHYVQVSDLLRARLALKVPVQQTDGQEERLVLALEVSQHLDHPVDHAGAQSWRDFVTPETVVGQILSLELAHVQVDLTAVLHIHVNVLPLNFVSLSPRQVHRRVTRSEVAQHQHLLS